MDDLVQSGYIVVPTPLTNNERRAIAQQQFLSHFLESPEFLNPNPLDPTWKPVLGGFAACGNPSSFHHPILRKFRQQVLAHVLEIDLLPLNGRRLEKPYDRVTFRRVGQSPTAENAHRDEAPTAIDGDDVFGGWLNLDDHDQHFTCAPGSHTDVGNQNKGFAKITDPEELDNYYSRRITVSIPPGCMLVFYERIVHEVTRSVAERDLMRIHIGFRITDSTTPLFPNMATVIAEQGVPFIKSGQYPPVYPSAYTNFPRNFTTLTDWSIRTYQSSILYRHTVKSGLSKGDVYYRVPAKMQSLQSLGLPLHAPYDANEIALLSPQREWTLHTFESEEQMEHQSEHPSEHQVRIVAPSEDDWRSYMAAVEQVGSENARRPRPEFV